MGGGFMGYDPRSEEEVTKFAVQTALDITPNMRL
jgi:hypothetical protein